MTVTKWKHILLMWNLCLKSPGTVQVPKRSINSTTTTELEIINSPRDFTTMLYVRAFTFPTSTSIFEDFKQKTISILMQRMKKDRMRSLRKFWGLAACSLKISWPIKVNSHGKNKILLPENLVTYTTKVCQELFE